MTIEICAVWIAADFSFPKHSKFGINFTSSKVPTVEASVFLCAPYTNTLSRKQYVRCLTKPLRVVQYMPPLHTNLQQNSTKALFLVRYSHTRTHGVLNYPPLRQPNINDRKVFKSSGFQSPVHPLRRAEVRCVFTALDDGYLMNELKLCSLEHALQKRNINQ